MPEEIRRNEKPNSTMRPPTHGTGARTVAPPSAFYSAPIFYLRTKLLPPRPAPAVLARPRLTKRLLDNLARPVTLVTAPAGSGKTTLVADFLRAHEAKSVWYQLDSTDADPALFLGYIAYGIGRIVPGFGKETLAFLHSATDQLTQQPERAVDVFLNEVFERIEQQLVLVLDDYHHLGTETPVHRMVDRLLAYLPDVMHVIITARDVPPLALARLRSHSSLTIIDRAELLFTDAETQELFRSVFNLELSTEQLAEYRERTHGWITALQLVRQVAERESHGETDGTPDLIEVLRQSERDIFDYFAEEVFADETPEVQQLLMRLSLLEAIETDACLYLFPEANPVQTLETLVRRNVFLTLATDAALAADTTLDEKGSQRTGRADKPARGEANAEEYRLHPLFQSFLRRRLRAECGAQGVAVEHKRCADYYLQRGAWEQAMSHLRDAADWDTAARTLAIYGGELIAAGALASLTSFAEMIPQAWRDKRPRVLLHEGEVARLRGDHKSAEALFVRAAPRLQTDEDAEGEADALHSLAAIARRRGDCAKAFEYLDQATELAGENSTLRTKCANTRGLCLVGMGQWAAAEREFRAALQSAEAHGDARLARLIAHNLGIPAGIRGDFGEALRWLGRMIGHSNGNPGGESRTSPAATPPLPQEATAHLNMARCHLYRGEFASCEHHLDQSLERCQMFNLLALRGEIFEAYGNLYRKQMDAARAAEYYNRAARAYEEAGIDATRHELPEEQALLVLQNEDAATALRFINRLVEARQTLGDDIGTHTALLTRGRIYLVQGDDLAAQTDLEAALGCFRANSLYYNEAQTQFALAACGRRRGDEEAVLTHLRRALDLALRYDYDYWLRREVARAPELFASPDALALLPPDVRSALNDVELNDAPAPVAIHAATFDTTSQAKTRTAVTTLTSVASPVAHAVEAAPRADLTLNLLGPVEIYRDAAKPFATDAWITKRSRDILCFVAARAHRRAAKDIIKETFWSDVDIEIVEKNFHPTISHIRKALNSNQPLKQNFLLYRDGDYMLNPEFTYAIDTEEFDQLIRDGERAERARAVAEFVPLYERVAALYRGEFMNGVYDEWTNEPRAYYREQYLRILKTLAGVAASDKEWARALDLAHKILHGDPFQEDVHCLAMQAYAALGNRNAVSEQYETLRRLLRKELAVEPSAETKKIVRELVS